MADNLEVSAREHLRDGGERWFRYTGSEPVSLLGDLQARCCSDPLGLSRCRKDPLSEKVIVCVK